MHSGKESHPAGPVMRNCDEAYDPGESSVRNKRNYASLARGPADNSPRFVRGELTVVDNWLRSATVDQTAGGGPTCP